MAKLFGRGEKKKTESKEKPVDQVFLDMAAEALKHGSKVVTVSGGQVKELSAADIERQQRAREFEKVGDAHFELGQYPQAIEAYKEALEIYPDEVLYMNIGNAYCSMAQYDVGIPYLEKALEINPNYERARRNLQAVKDYLASQRRRH
jgi:tetratricopeptide (TPR) repeat protein